jgi:mannose-6-phosphate isomerase
VNLCPARFDPIFSTRPWGALSLAPLFPEKSSLPEPIGEAWMTGDESRFANGPFAGKKLSEAWPQMTADWRGTQAERESVFPLLVKFLFAEDKPSVQVHPDDAYAAKNEAAAGGRGKTEMWYIHRARLGAGVLAGLKPDVTLEKFKRAIVDGTAEKCLERIPLREGDAVFIPAGTAHTIGAGLVICEIQQTSDLTYRVYDYNRRDANGNSRPLHIEKALDVMRFGKQTGGKLDPVKIVQGGIAETFLVACRYFATERWDFAESVATTSSSQHFDLIVFLEGNGDIGWGKSSSQYGPAQVWMIPAALGAYQMVPNARTSLLRTYVPGDLNQYARRLEDQGVAKADLSRIIYP